VAHFQKCSQDFNHRTTELMQTVVDPWCPGEPVPGGLEQDKSAFQWLEEEGFLASERQVHN